MPKSVTVVACLSTVLAGLTATAVLFSATVAARADDCLAAPDHAAGPGGHWAAYIDRASKRKCWIVVDATGHPVQEPETLGSLFSKWTSGLTAGSPPDTATDSRTPGGRTDESKPHSVRQRDVSLNPKPHRPPPAETAHPDPAPRPDANPPGTQSDPDALFQQFLRWKEHQPPQKRTEQ